MIIACPNFNIPEVAQEFNELKDAIGEKAAYAVWSLNNGNGIEKTPWGVPSQLFQDLVAYYGNRQDAIKALATVYGNTYRQHIDWINNGANVEPSLSDAVNNTDPFEDDYDNIAADLTINAMMNLGSISSRLDEDFRHQVNTTGMTQDEIDHERYLFYADHYHKAVNSVISRLAKNLGLKIVFKNANTGEIKTKKRNFLVRPGIKRTIGNTAANAAFWAGMGWAASIFFPFAGITVVGAAKVGAAIGMLYANSLFSYDMRKDFIETMYKRLADPKYSEFALQVINSLYSGDPIDGTLNIRLVADIYVDMFRSDELVLSAINELLDINPGLGWNEIKLKIVDNVVSEVDGHSPVSAVWHSILNAVAKFRKNGLLTAVFNKTCEHIARAMCSKLILTHVKKDAIFKSLRKYGQVIKGAPIEGNEAVIKSLIALNKARLERAKMYSNEKIDEDEIKRYEQHITQLEQVNVEDSDEVNSTMINFINSAYNELCDVLTWISNNQNIDSDDFDRDYANKVRNQIILGYNYVLNTFMQPYASSPLCNDVVRAELEELSKTLVEAKRQIDDLNERWSDVFIEDYVQYATRGNFDFDIEDEGVITTGTRRYIENAKLSLHNKIRKTGFAHYFNTRFRALAAAESSFKYANLDDNIIINIVDHMVRTADHKVNEFVRAKNNHLVSLYNKTRGILSGLDPINGFKLYVEYDGNGRTANFISPVNVGKYENELHAHQLYFFRKVITPLVKDILLLLENIDDIENGVVAPNVAKALHRVESFPECPSDIISYLRSTQVGASFDDYEYTFKTSDPMVNKVWKNANDKFDGGYDYKTNEWTDVRKHKRYTWQYYVTRRNYLSSDTEEAYEEISKAISAIKQQMYDKDLKFYDNRKISRTLQVQLKLLEFKLEQLSNPYDITIDAHGNVISAVLKEGDAARMAEELRMWNEASRKHIARSNDEEKFNKIELIMQSRSLAEYQQFMLENIYTAADDYVHHILPDDIDPELLRLIQKKNFILKYAKKNPKNYEVPNYHLFSPLVFLALKEIDEEIDEYFKNNPPAVKNFEGLEDELEKYHNLTWLEDAKNPATGVPYFDEVYIKYGSAMNNVLYYVNRFGDRVRTSAFNFRHYEDDALETKYSNQFSIIGGDWVDQDWKESDDFLNVDENRYKNEKYDELISDPKRKAFYDAIIDTMDEIWENIPQHRRHYKYLMPLVLQEGLFSRALQLESSGLKTRGSLRVGIHDLWSEISGTNENSDEFTEQFRLDANGDAVQEVPMRYIQPLKGDSWAVDTDIIKTVMMMYEMALNFNNKKNVEQDAIALLDVMGGGFAGMKSEQLMSDYKRLKNYINGLIYENTRNRIKINGTGRMTKFERTCWKMARLALSLTAKSFLNWNVTSWGKNAMDSLYALVGTAMTGFKLGWSNILNGVGYMMKDLIFAFGDIGSNKSHSWTGAAMLYHNMHEEIEYTASGASKSWLNRFIRRFFLLGPFKLIDYTFKGLILNATYDHYHLITDPITGKLVFMTKQQCRRKYTNYQGRLKSDADRYYNNSNITLRDAYEIDKEGSFVLKPQFKDIVNPIKTKDFQFKYDEKVRQYEAEIREKTGDPTFNFDPNSNSKDNKYIKRQLSKFTRNNSDYSLSSELTGRLNELSSYVNGMFSKYKDSYATMNVVGAMFFLMRGWLVTQWNHHFTDGTDMIKHSIVDGVFLAEDPKNRKQEDLLGKANLATGDIERGFFVGNVEAGIGKLFAAPFMKNRSFGKLLRNITNFLVKLSKGLCYSLMFKTSDPNSLTNALTEHEKTVIKNMLAVNLIMLFNIEVSKYTSQWVESADEKAKTELTLDAKMEDALANYVYAVNTGVQSEQLSKWNRIGLLASMVDVINSPIVTTGYLEDVGEIAHGLNAAYDYGTDLVTGPADVFNWFDDTNFYTENGWEATIYKPSSYQYMTEGQRAMLLLTSVMPGLNEINVANAFKSMYVPALKQKARYSHVSTQIPGFGHGETTLKFEFQDWLGKYLPLDTYYPGNKQYGLIPHLLSGESDHVTSGVLPRKIYSPKRRGGRRR